MRRRVCFTAQDTILKYVSGAYPLTEAMALRAVVAGPILGLLIWRTEGFAALAQNAGFLLTRAVVLFFAYFAYYWRSQPCRWPMPWRCILPCHCLLRFLPGPIWANGPMQRCGVRCSSG